MPAQQDHRPTVLLLGGHSGTGKTTLAPALAQWVGGSVLQVDDIRLVLQQVVSAQEQPDLHFFLQPDVLARHTDDQLCAGLAQVGAFVCASLEVVVGHHLATNIPLVLEGDGLVPAFAARQTFDGVSAAGRVASVFLIEEDEQALLTAMLTRGRGGMTQMSAAARRWNHLSWRYGVWLAQQARECGLPTVAARPWETLEERLKTILQERAW